LEKSIKPKEARLCDRYNSSKRRTKGKARKADSKIKPLRHLSARFSDLD
jgi:hypothetical protein